MKPQNVIPLLLALVTVGCSPTPTYPALAACNSLPLLDNYRELDAFTLPLRFENQMGAIYEVARVCISIDDRRIRQDDAAVVAGFAARRPLEIRVGLRPGVSHRVRIVTAFAGLGDLDGLVFVVNASREVQATDIASGTLQGTFIEKPNIPLEKQATVVWTWPDRRP